MNVQNRIAELKLMVKELNEREAKQLEFMAPYMEMYRGEDIYGDDLEELVEESSAYLAYIRTTRNELSKELENLLYLEKQVLAETKALSIQNTMFESLYVCIVAILAFTVYSLWNNGFGINGTLMPMFAFAVVSILAVFVFKLKIGSKLYMIILMGVMLTGLITVGGISLLFSTFLGWILLLMLHGKGGIFF